MSASVDPVCRRLNRKGTTTVSVECGLWSDRTGYSVVYSVDSVSERKSRPILMLNMVLKEIMVCTMFGLARANRS